MCWVHVLVLVEIVVEVVERLQTLVSVQVDGVGLRSIGGFEGAGDQRHELPEDADAAVPEGGLREASRQSPAAQGRVVGLHHVRQLKRVVVTTGDVQLTAQHRHAAANMDLETQTNDPPHSEQRWES